MAKLPWFQFYVDDWLNEPGLKVCSHNAKGVFIDMICLMHKSDERGVLISAGRAWTDHEVVCAVGGDSNMTASGLHELLTRGVISRDSRGAYFSRRMVRDEAKRLKCSEAGKRGGGSPLLSTYKGHPKGASKGGLKGGLKGASGSGSASDSLPEPAPVPEPDSARSINTKCGVLESAELVSATGAANDDRVRPASDPRAFGHRRTRIMLATAPCDVDTPFIGELARSDLPVETIADVAQQIASDVKVRNKAAVLRRRLERDHGLKRRAIR